MNISWELKVHYSYPGPDFWETEEVLINPLQGYYAKGMVETRANGPKTACASVDLLIKWDPSRPWGIRLNRHFKGPRAGQQARVWCRYVMENPPSNWEVVRE